MREAVGEVDCRYCDSLKAEVRKNEKGKLYLYCKECGIHHLNTPAGQNWILTHATMYGAEGRPEPAPKPAAAPKPAPAPKPKPAPAPKPAPVPDDLDDNAGGDDDDDF